MSFTRNAKPLLTLVVLFIINARTGQAITCSKCSTSSTTDDCVTSPPSATNCNSADTNCIAIAMYRQSGELFSFIRACSPSALGEACIGGTDKATLVPLRICYTTCSGDGCNGYTNLHHFLDLLRRK